ncbi:MAG: hypothetical protein ACYTJ0_19860, partial [Planctomycetota bacterium]
MPGSTVIAVLGCVTLVALASGAAAVLRRARCPGATVLGGVAVGLLLGASVAGRVWPQLHETTWLGGAEPRAARERLLRQHGAERAGAEHVRMGEAAHAEMLRRQEAEQHIADEAWQAARWSHQRTVRGAVLILVALVLIAGGAGSATARGEPRPGTGVVLSLGTWAAAVPGAIAYAVLARVLGFGTVASMLAAAALAMGPLALTPIDRRAADDAELGGARLVQAAGRLMSLLAVALAGVAIVSARHWYAGPSLAALAAIVAGWLVPGGAARRLEPLARGVLVPSLAAIATLPVDLAEDAALWPIVLALLVSGDARWLGATVDRRQRERPHRQRRRRQHRRH